MKIIYQMGIMGIMIFSNQGHAKSFSSREFPHVSGEVLVKIKQGYIGKFLAKKSLLGLEVNRELKTLAGQYLVLKSQDKAAPILLKEVNSMAEVEYAELNYIYKTSLSFPTIHSILSRTVKENASALAPQDPLYEKLWGMNNTGRNEPSKTGDYSGNTGVAHADIDAQRAWEITKGSKKVVIAVIDTGIDFHHPDLVNNIWSNSREVPGNGIDDDQNGYIDDIHGWNAQGKNGNPIDGHGHGTHCSGTIGAEHNNGQGVAGVMDEVSLMAVKFLGDDGSGNLADAIEAINYATKMNVDIMSNSWGGGGYSQALEDAIKLAQKKGIIFVAAAGNDGDNNDATPHYPASYQLDNVISVASHTVNDSISSFSCFGKKTVHVAAPGSNILSTVPNSEYKVFSGTSMATPHVSGVVGLLLSKEGNLSPTDVRNRLMATSHPASVYRRTVASGGRVSAYNLLTNTHIPRSTPDEAAWRVEDLSEVFETQHPYKNDQKITKVITYPGAKYIRLMIEKYDLEKGYDFLTIKDGNGSVVEKITGDGVNYETEYADSDTLTLEFDSDTSQTRWGVLIRQIKVIY
ncbi:MAG: S8 family serine peptidase [Bacteriovoracaceae bacterium]